MIAALYPPPGTGPPGVAGYDDPPPTPEETFRDYAPRVHRLARRMLGNDADAADVTQEVFVQVLRKLETFRGEAGLGTWLFRLAVRAIWRFRQRLAARARHEAPDPHLDFHADNGHAGTVSRGTADPVDRVLQREAREQIEKAIARLPEQYRVVLLLADVEGLSGPEVGSVLGLSLPAVKSRLHRARRLLRKDLAAYFVELAA